MIFAMSEVVRKVGLSLTLKEGVEGVGVAIIATTNTGPDKDGDVYGEDVLGGKKQSSQILPAHDHRSVPLGKATVYQTETDTRADLVFNMDIEEGRKWASALKFDQNHGEPPGEWSHGFDVLNAADKLFEGRPVTSLEKLDIFEVSPVVRGAGNDTSTLQIKGEKDEAAENAAASATAHRSSVGHSSLRSFKNDSATGISHPLGNAQGMVRQIPTGCERQFRRSERESGYQNRQ